MYIVYEILKCNASSLLREARLYVGKRGIEPPRDCSHRILSPARLPVPPPARYKFFAFLLYQGLYFFCFKGMDVEADVVDVNKGVVEAIRSVDVVGVVISRSGVFEVGSAFCIVSYEEMSEGLEGTFFWVK